MVVNMRVAKFDVYIGRGRGGSVPNSGRGMFGNPIAVGNKCPECGLIHWSAADTLNCYRRYLERRLKDIDFKVAFMKLRGKTLGCFCKPGPCHGDVIEEVLQCIE